MRSGLFITFEGPDGAGKTTQIHKLADYLSSRGMDLVLTREPGGTRIGEKIRDIILDPQYQEMDSLTETLLYASARTQHIVEKIRPALNEGKTVICDRFMDSSIAYQGYGRKLGEKVRIINEIAVGEIIPDLTFLLLIDPEQGKKRINERAGKGLLDRIELEEIQYHKDVYQGYLELAHRNPDRILIIDGLRRIEEISTIIIEKTAQSLRKHQGQ